MRGWVHLMATMGLLLVPKEKFVSGIICYFLVAVSFGRLPLCGRSPRLHFDKILRKTRCDRVMCQD